MLRNLLYFPPLRLNRLSLRKQLSLIHILANEYHFPVVPRGAGTGLACGAVPIYGGVVLSLEKKMCIRDRFLD